MDKESFDAGYKAGYQDFANKLLIYIVNTRTELEHLKNATARGEKIILKHIMDEFFPDDRCTG